MEHLPESECWRLLRANEVGRLATALAGRPDIFPINYAVDHATLVFRTAQGSKLAGALGATSVAFEVDGYESDYDEAWSVVLHGQAEAITDPTELVETTALRLHPWSAEAKPHFVRIVPQDLSGRRFPVADPSIWRSPLYGSRMSSAE